MKKKKEKEKKKFKKAPKEETLSRKKNVRSGFVKRGDKSQRQKKKKSKTKKKKKKKKIASMNPSLSELCLII